jgi:hypothetical protein
MPLPFLLKEWKGDWKEEFHTNQAELFRHIRDRKNLEILLDRKLEKINYVSISTAYL